jgi:aspartate kinase
MFPTKKKLVVVSAMGKTTNALEEVVDALCTNNHESFRYLVEEIIKYHLKIVDNLFHERHEGLMTFLEDLHTIPINFESPTCCCFWASQPRSWPS